MEVEHHSEVSFIAPVQKFHQQLESIFVAGAVLIPHLNFIDWQPDVIEADRIDKLHILFRKECSTLLSSGVALRKPVRDVRATLNGESHGLRTV
jgi:hypothetical protein